MSKYINVAVVGATGYIGLELIKLLIKHPKVKIKNICAQRSIGKSMYSIDSSLIKKSLPKITNLTSLNFNNIDLLFTALPNGEAQKISKKLNPKVKLIDLSADFRLESPKNYKKWYNITHKSKNLIKHSIYSIPELIDIKLDKFKIIACPGCYPTSIQLPLVPIIKKRLINTNNIIIDSKSNASELIVSPSIVYETITSDAPAVSPASNSIVATPSSFVKTLPELGLRIPISLANEKLTLCEITATPSLSNVALNSKGTKKL
jgi:N-acetyl-gamma-glutamyl-phosphate reductase common form